MPHTGRKDQCRGSIPVKPNGSSGVHANCAPQERSTMSSAAFGAADATHPNQAARMPNTCVTARGCGSTPKQQVKALRRRMCAAGAGHDE
eukprot:3628298-Alexandrium_andersonii.AAC.1